MTALSADKPLSRETWNDRTFTLKSGESVWKGALIAIELGGGYVVEATGASDEILIGTAMERVDASAAAKSLAVRLNGEVEILYLANGSSIAATDLGALCYVADDQTVSLSPASAGTCLAGRVWGLDSVRGVMVELLKATPTAVLVERVPPAHVSNDVIVTSALAVHGSVFDIATTASATTVTLPAIAIEGAELTFVADGTKNGHTVQYRDATGPANLTTALTASKRHLVKVVYLNAKWYANAYVSP